MNPLSPSVDKGEVGRWVSLDSSPRPPSPQQEVCYCKTFLHKLGIQSHFLNLSVLFDPDDMDLFGITGFYFNENVNYVLLP